MRINSIPPKEIYSQYMLVKDIRPVVAQSQSFAADHVEVSDSAKSFSATLKAVKESFHTEDPSRAERISTIRQQIADNTYSVPSAQVADKILGRI